MKRQLLVVRHAKAEDGSYLLADFDRHLTASGNADAARMGEFLAQQGFKPDWVVSSLAPRAFQTAKIMAEQLGFDAGQIQATRDLYNGGTKAYLAAVTNAPAHTQTMLIYGHNPDVSYFSEYITHRNIGSMSKGAVVIIEFEDLEWAAISARTGKFVDYYAPKSFRK